MGSNSGSIFYSLKTLNIPNQDRTIGRDIILTGFDTKVLIHHFQPQNNRNQRIVLELVVQLRGLEKDKRNIKGTQQYENVSPLKRTLNKKNVDNVLKISENTQIIKKKVFLAYLRHTPLPLF